MRVVKLRLQNKNNEIRRIAGTDVAEYTQLKKAAMEFSNLPFDKVDEYDIRFIYQDEDGDSITFSTEKEYHEAWLYIPQQDETSTHQVFRMTAMINNKKEPSKSTNPTPSSTFINGQHVCNGMWADECAYVLDKMFCKRAMKRAQQHALQYVKEPSPVFIHGRHTCDGCNVKPIIGYRHHSLHIPDYDLCDTCFKSKKGDDRQVLGPFNTVELKRDYPFQELWKKKKNQTHVHTQSMNVTDIATLAAKKARKKIEASGKLSDDFPSAENSRCGIALLAAEAARRKLEARAVKAVADAMEKKENEYSEASVTTDDSSTKSTKFTEKSSSSSKDEGKTTKNNDSGSLDGWENLIQEQTTFTKSSGDVPVHVLYVFEDELKKLHELGFTDDVKSVEVLESLQAANIGVDSNDPVRIETVVERLLNMK